MDSGELIGLRNPLTGTCGKVLAKVTHSDESRKLSYQDWNEADSAILHVSHHGKESSNKEYHVAAVVRSRIRAVCLFLS
jgi:hypothetical protein